MVSILERLQAFGRVRVLAMRMFETPIQRAYDVGGRSILNQLSAAWSLTSITEVTEQIQEFIAPPKLRGFS
jgi:hypothetical protein